jgi:hypothetical protein
MLSAGERHQQPSLDGEGRCAMHKRDGHYSVFDWALVSVPRLEIRWGCPDRHKVDGVPAQASSSSAPSFLSSINIIIFALDLWQARHSSDAFLIY